MEGGGLPTPPPHGARIETAGSGDPALQPNRRVPIVALIGAIVAFAIAVAYFAFRPTSSHATAAPPSTAEKSVAVLPFLNMSSDRENEYLSDGITEEILNMLAKVPGLRVPARTSSFVFKGKTDDIKKIGELLGVKTVLEGSVQRSGNQLKVTAQLINVADGYHLWSETYPREMTNIFAIEEDIARTIVAKLKVTLGASTELPFAKRRTENVEAYELVLQGRFHREKFTERELKVAISYYEKALAKQPDYALAYTGLAQAYSLLRYYSYVAPGSITPQFRAAVAKALELDDTLAEAHLALALVNCYVDWEWSAAERAFRRAVELEPAHVTAHWHYALFLGAMGRHAEALAEATKAQQLDPLSVLATVMVGYAYYFAQDYDRTVKVGREAIAMAPDFFTAHQLIGWALFRKGKRDEGIAEMEEARRLAPVPETLGYLGNMYGQEGRKADAQKVLEELLTQATQHYVPAAAIAGVYDGLGDFEQSNMWRNKAITDREGRVIFIKVISDDLFRANPHYPEWLKKIGLDK